MFRILLTGLVLSATLAQPASAQYIRDTGSPPIAEIVAYVPLGPDSALAIDNREAVFLLVSDERVATIGSIGEGPCQYTDVTSFATAGDTLLVLDRRLGRVVQYSISRGDCAGETTSPGLAGVSGIAAAGGSWFFIAEGYAAPTDPEKPLLFAMREGGELAPLALTKGDLDANMLLMPVRLRGRFKQIRSKQGRVYFLLPYSHRVWSYDVRTSEVAYFELEHEETDISAYAEETDLARVARAISSLDTHFNLFLLERHIAVQSRVNNGWMLGLYTYAGDLLFREELPEMIAFERGGKFFALEATMEDSRPYRIRPIPLDLNR